MSLKFFVDQCVPGSVIQFLRNADHEILILKEHILKESPDSVVIKKTQQLKAILISLNGDFADIVTYPPSNYSGIIAIQLKNHPEVITQMLERLNKYFLLNDNMEHYKGKLFLVEAHRIRVRT